MGDTRYPIGARRRGPAFPARALWAWLGRGRPPFLGRLAVALGAALCGCLVLMGYESRALGLAPFRYEPAAFGGYGLVRTGFAAVAAWLLVRILADGAARSAGPRRRPLRLAESGLALGAMALALGCVGLFVADPAAFDRMAAEDAPVEWLTALLLLGASGLFAADVRRRWRGRGGRPIALLGLLLSVIFALLLFAAGMEEVSWLQRLLGFDTPAAVAQANWQHEFNLHNTHTFLFNCVYYAGSATFLVLLPLLAEAAPNWAPLLAVEGHLPWRSIAALSAPVSMFNFGHWNLVPIQFSLMLSLCALLGFAGLARRRGDAREGRLFLFLAAAVAAGQAAFLIFGPSLPPVPDSTEYQELFIALGFFAFAWQARGRFAA